MSGNKLIFSIVNMDGRGDRNVQKTKDSRLKREAFLYIFCNVKMIKFRESFQTFPNNSTTLCFYNDISETLKKEGLKYGT